MAQVRNIHCRRSYRDDPVADKTTDGGWPSVSAEAKISHVVPSLELKGSREQKLRQLNDAIQHLEELRCRIAGGVQAYTAAVHGSADAPAWPWVVAGVVIAMLPILAVLLRAGG
jgi:hypothetical protein